MGLLLGAHGGGAASVFVPQAGLAGDGLAVVEGVGLAAQLVFEGADDGLDGVDVFHFHADAKLGLADGAEGEAGLEPQVAFLHLALAHAQVAEDDGEGVHVGVGLGDAAQVGLGDDLDEGRAGAIEVHHGHRGDAGAGAGVEGAALGFEERGGVVGVDELAGVFLDVDVVDAHRAGVAVDVEVDGAVHAEVVVELRGLVVLGQVGVVVVFSVEHGVAGDVAAEGEGGLDGVVDGGAVDDGQHAGMAGAHGAGVGVGRRAEGGAAPAEHLGLRRQMGVGLEPDDDLVLHRSVPLQSSAGRWV